MSFHQLISEARNYVSPDQVTTVAFHSPCLDGAAAAVATTLYNPDVELIRFVHGTDPAAPFQHLKSSAVLLFVDCAPPLATLVDLRARLTKVMVLDHHIGNQRDLSVEGCFFHMEASGAEMSWAYFHDKPIPELLKIIGERDLWNFSNPATRPVGLALMDMKIDVDDLKSMTEGGADGVQSLVSAGESVQKKITSKCASLTVGFGRWSDKYDYAISKMDGYEFLSECAEFIYTTHPQADFVVVYYIQSDGRYKLSFRTDKDGVDCSVIAKTFGGNGHAKAAGATVNELTL